MKGAKTHHAGDVTPEGQFCLDCGFTIATPEQLRYGGYLYGRDVQETGNTFPKPRIKYVKVASNRCNAVAPDHRLPPRRKAST